MSLSKKSTGSHANELLRKKQEHPFFETVTFLVTTASHIFAYIEVGNAKYPLIKDELVYWQSTELCSLFVP